jgi:hypothetical protein
MCCIFAALVFFGPRLAFLVWWLIQPARINATFNTFIWPLLGLIFLPWTTLAYLLVYGANGIVSFDWVWLGLALIVDIASYGGGAYNRRRVPYYTGP